MIPTTPEYDAVVATDHNIRFKATIEHDGVVVAELQPHSGGVQINRNSLIRRTVTCSLADPTGELTPAGAGDLLAPISAILRPYLGAEIPLITRVSRVDDTQAQWAEGTHMYTVAVATAGGRLEIQ